LVKIYPLLCCVKETIDINYQINQIESSQNRNQKSYNLINFINHNQYENILSFTIHKSIAEASVSSWDDDDDLS